MTRHFFLLTTLYRHGSHHALSPGLQRLGLCGCDSSSCTSEPEAASALCQCECTHTHKENHATHLMGVLALTTKIFGMLLRRNFLIIPLCSVILLAPCACRVAMIPLGVSLARSGTDHPRRSARRMCLSSLLGVSFISPSFLRTTSSPS